MENTSTGKLIAKLRRAKGLTQRQLAGLVSVSDKAVSKWERDGGMPDISLLPALASALGVGVDALLSGGLDENEEVKGNMKKTSFYVCPECGNILTSTGESELSCCGRPLTALTAGKPDEAHDLTVETVEDEWYISSKHPMEREHYIKFAALLRSDRLEIVRTYPEWEFQTRFPKREHGRLLWYCTRHGLFEKNI